VEKIDLVHKKIGENVKRVRKMKKISQLDLAHLIGHKSVSIISLAEIYHKKQHFNINHLVKISEVLKVSILEFFEGVDKIIENK